MNLADPQGLKAFLGRHGLRADKSLGQHFLCSEGIVEAIVLSVSHCKGVLEIGPGPGVLTSRLNASAESVTAIEVDPKMAGLLSESAPRANVIQSDALKADLPSLLEALPEPRAVVGNLPYYITGPLLTHISEARALFDRAVVMVQREVAQRITAPPGISDRGSLSVFLQAQFDVSVLIQAPSGVFLPPPKVDSTVLVLCPRALQVDDPTHLFRLIRLGFAQPRKTLLNNLVAGYRVDRPQALEWLDALPLRGDIRPHMLSLDDWVGLVGQIPPP